MKQKCCQDFADALEKESLRLDLNGFVVINEIPYICEGELQGNYDGIKITFCPFCGRKIGE